MRSKGIKIHPQTDIIGGDLQQEFTMLKISFKDKVSD